MAMPKGFQQTTGGGCARFVQVDKGVIVTGDLVGFVETKIKGRRREIFMIRLDEPTTIYDADEKANRMAKRGEIVGLDSRHGYAEDFRRIVTQDKAHKVWVEFVDKEDIDGGNTVWRCEAGFRTIDGQG